MLQDWRSKNQLQKETSKLRKEKFMLALQSFQDFSSGSGLEHP
jgi:hypothetical protein